MNQVVTIQFLIGKMCQPHQSQFGKNIICKSNFSDMNHLFLHTPTAQCTNLRGSSSHNSIIIHLHVCLPQLAWGPPMARQKLCSMQLYILGAAQSMAHRQSLTNA